MPGVRSTDMNGVGVIFGRLGYRGFRVVKYATYCALCLNIGLFLQQEMQTLAHSGVGEGGLARWVQVFSATLDTAAWVLLLLLFELETAVIPDHRLVGPTRWAIHGVRLLCGLAIVAAFTGYWGEWVVLFDAGPLMRSACDLADTGAWSLMRGFDDFTALDATSCLGADATWVSLDGLDQVVASGESWAAARWLAFTDVLNAGAWILVVVVLEVEVRMLESTHPRLQLLKRLFHPGKMLLYAILAGAAIYWGVAGEFLDFWDAALWLFAFVFIELNVFEWQRELRGAKDTLSAGK